MTGIRLAASHLGGEIENLKKSVHLLYRNYTLMKNTGNFTCSFKVIGKQTRAWETEIWESH